MKKIVSFLVLGLVLSVFSDEVVLISHKGNPQNSLKAKELKRIYFGRMKAWSNGTPIVAVDLSLEDPSRKAFSNKVLKKVPKVMKRLYLKRALSGRSQPPKQVSSPEKMLSFVAKTPGAMGYVLKSAVTDKVKIIEIVDLNTIDCCSNILGGKQISDYARIFSN